MRTGAGTIKVISVGDESDLARLADFEAVADHLMLDAKAPPGADRPGGHGDAVRLVLTYGRKFARPWLLAGGLDPYNVVEAVRLSRRAHGGRFLWRGARGRTKGPGSHRGLPAGARARA